MTTTEIEACTPVESHAIGLDGATTVAGALTSIADPLRLRMLSAIATDPRGEACVCDLTELADVSQPTISHHLKVFKETGMLLSERRGTWVYYRIAPARRSAVTALLDAFAPAATLDVIEDDTERVEALRTMDARAAHLAEELSDELTDLNRDLVIAIVREPYAGLVRSAKLTQHMIPLTERFARQRLADLTRDRTAGVPEEPHHDRYVEAVRPVSSASTTLAAPRWPPAGSATSPGTGLRCARPGPCPRSRSTRSRSSDA